MTDNLTYYLLALASGYTVAYGLGMMINVLVWGL